MPRASLPSVLTLLAAGLAAPGCDDGGGTTAEVCINGLDDDGDGATDCADGDCAAAPACVPAEVCGNGLDDDGDGATDCADGDCAADPACLPAEDCGNGADDDLDGATDCADDDCTAAIDCVPPPNETDCRDGLDDDRDGATDCADDDCAAASACSPPLEDCANAIDDDLDGDTDCADDDCAADRACAAACHDGLDAFEDNDDAATATGVASVPADAVLCAVAGDDDVFAIEACVGGALAVSVPFVHALGDIDLELLSAGGTRLAGAWSGDDDETFSWTGDRRGTVYLRVAMYTPDACNTYRLGATLDDAACVWTEPDCANGLDDDGDGLTDCDDPDDCATAAACIPEADCRNGLDDDGDGLTDCDDPGCLATADCTASGNDDCTAPFVLPDDPSGTWYGDTSGMSADVRGTCAGVGNDAVFRLTLTARATLLAETAGSSFDTVLYLRDGDCAAGAEIACNDDVSRRDNSSILEEILEPGTYHLLVDGYDAAARGDYVLHLATTSAKGGAVDRRALP